MSVLTQKKKRQSNTDSPESGKQVKTCASTGNKDTRKNGEKVSKEDYAAMRRAYARKQTIQSVAKACSVSPTTARKYILKGDKRRGLPAIHDLWASSQVQALEEEGRTLAKARTEHLKMVDQMLEKYGTAIAKLDPEKIRPEALVSGIEKLIALQEHLLTPVKNEKSITKDRFDGWTEEELLEYAQKGICPERDRMGYPPPRK